MMHRSSENSAEELRPFATQSWEKQGGDTFIADIEALGIEEERSRFVGQGQTLRWSRGDPALTLMSEGFARCTAAIIHNSATGSFDFAHVQPFDYSLYKEMQALDFGEESHAFFVFGKYSVHQYDLEKLLTQCGAKIVPVRVDTGEAHFSVALDVKSGSVSVARKTPDHTIFQYRPFMGA